MLSGGTATQPPLTTIICDVALWALPIAGALGSIVFIGSAELSGYRILLMLLTLLGTLQSTKNSRIAFSAIRGLLPLIVIWAGVAILLSSNVPDTNLVLSEVINLFFGFLALWIILETAGSPRRLHIFCRGWVTALFLVLALGYREVQTGSHLANYAIKDQILSSTYSPPASTFGNPNNLAIFLAMSWVLVGVWGERSGRPWSRILGYILVLASLPLLLQTGSRIALVVCGVLTFVRLCLLSDRRRMNLLLLSAIALTGCVFYSPDAFGIFTPGIAAQGILDPASWLREIAQAGTSGGVRLNLTLNGAYLTWITWFIGAGPGGFRWANFMKEVPLPTFQITDPHNLWVEVSSQYGIVVLLLFVSVLLRVFLSGLRHLHVKDTYTRTLARSLVLAMSLMPVGALSASSYLKLPYFWLFLGFCFAAFAYMDRGSYSLDLDSAGKAAAMADSHVRRTANPGKRGAMRQMHAARTDHEV